MEKLSNQQMNLDVKTCPFSIKCINLWSIPDTNEKVENIDSTIKGRYFRIVLTKTIDIWTLFISKNFNMSYKFTAHLIKWRSALYAQVSTALVLTTRGNGCAGSICN